MEKLLIALGLGILIGGTVVGLFSRSEIEAANNRVLRAEEYEQLMSDDLDIALSELDDLRKANIAK